MSSDGMPSALFPYRLRAGQEEILREIARISESGGPLLVHAPTGSGKTVATLAPLLEHAEKADHKILYLVRTHAQEVQVLQEARAISHRLERPLLSIGLQGRGRRCLLLENVAEMKGATAEEHGKLCGDRKRATERGFREGNQVLSPPELPEGGPVDLVDLDGCVYYARVLQADMEVETDRLASKQPTPREFEEYCRTENLCPYELSKKLVPSSRVVTAPYAFFFHPHVRRSLYAWMGVGPERVDLVVDEAHNLPEYLRETTTVSLPLTSVRYARAELTERGDFQLPDGPSASRLLDIVSAAEEELLQSLVHEDDAILPPNVLEDGLLTALGGTSHRLDTWLGSLATWGENLREERRRERKLPRSWVHTVALTLLSWPQLDEPGYVKVATKSPRAALEAYALDASLPAQPVLECHTSVHLSGTLAPTDEYRDTLGLGERTRRLSVPSHFPPSHIKYLYDPTISTRFEEIRANPRAIPRISDRISSLLQSLPVNTAVFFPSFDLMEKAYHAGLELTIPPTSVIESPRVSTADLWRSIDAHKQGASRGVILGVSGGRIAEGLDFPGQELEAVVIVGIPYPRPTARREALRRFLDARTGRGWEYTMEIPARRAMQQAIGRMIRSEHDRGIAIILDHRAPAFADIFPGLEPIGNLAATARAFYGRRARWSGSPAGSPAPQPLRGDSSLPPS